MHAMVLYTPKPVEERPLVAAELPDPLPGPGRIRLRVRVCAICHTDLHTVEGELRLPRLPIVPGHQMVGVVDELGPGAARYRVGDRVGVGWLSTIEGECEFVGRAQENLCPNARFTGLHVDGGYAGYALADERFAFPIPERFGDLEAAPLLCAGIIGYRSLRLSDVRPGDRLGLYGFGASAHIAIQVARHWGCRVFVFSRGEEHRHLARELGASSAWPVHSAP
ncbi:MAG: alcohol dehydrogenase catalytic domain-containing protein, partial [Anaerolineae bacterium]|nr:alcohol dehydrogenase catalytic domain-containing protein [Anaerolineae bacterium]